MVHLAMELVPGCVHEVIAIEFVVSHDAVPVLPEIGATDRICPMCMQKVGMSMDDLVEGVVKGGPDVTLKAMTADNTVVISY